MTLHLDPEPLAHGWAGVFRVVDFVGEIQNRPNVLAWPVVRPASAGGRQLDQVFHRWCAFLEDIVSGRCEREQAGESPCMAHILSENASPVRLHFIMPSCSLGWVQFLRR